MMTNANDKPARPVKLTPDDARQIVNALTMAAASDTTEAAAHRAAGATRLPELLEASARRTLDLAQAIDAATKAGGFRFAPKSEG